MAAETLRRALLDARAAGVDELIAALPSLCPDLFGGWDVHAERLNSRVFRLKSTGSGGASVILKRLPPALAERNELLARRWLPGIGLAHAAPAIVATIENPHENCVWHVYEDLGPSVLDTRNIDQAAVLAAVDLIAQLHLSAADSVVLGDCRLHLGELGIEYFVSNVRDAIGALESLRTIVHTFTSTQRRVLDRLRERLDALHESAQSRAQLMRDHGGPDTLLHGDLWHINAVVTQGPTGPSVRFIDWDRVGVGPPTYDLSTFLYRFAPDDRSWILGRYRERLGQAGWRLPDAADLNGLCDTAECARYANRIVWPAAALRRENAKLSHWELEQILGWFEALEPVQPQVGGSVA